MKQTVAEVPTTIDELLRHNHVFSGSERGGSVFPLVFSSIRRRSITTTFAFEQFVCFFRNSE